MIIYISIPKNLLRTIPIIYYMKLQKKEGIYAIKQHGEIVYIGASSNLDRRIRQYTTAKPNTPIQHAVYNNPDLFEFEILEYVPKGKVMSYMKKYLINKHKPFFNIKSNSDYHSTHGYLSDESVEK